MKIEKDEKTVIKKKCSKRIKNATRSKYSCPVKFRQNCTGREGTRMHKRIMSSSLTYHYTLINKLP